MAQQFDNTNGSNTQNDSFQNGPLEKLNQELYTPDEVPVYRPVSLPEWDTLHQAHQPQPEGWEPPPMPKPKKPRKPLSWTVWFLIAAAAFCILSAGLSFFFLYVGGRAVSSNKIVITVQGSNTISSGSAVPLTVTVQNNNPAAIENANISMTFPDGTRSASDMTQPLTLYSQDLGEMKPGTSVTHTVQAVFFGTTNQTVTVPITFQYHTANSNALFTKKQNYTLTITSSPLSITAKTVANASSGEPITISLAVRSSASSQLDNLAVAAQYPQGFTPAQTGTSTNFFPIGTLQPGQEKDLTIKGTLTGSTNDTRNFSFTVGTAKADGTPAIGVAYATQNTTIALTKAFLSADVSINHSDTDPAVVQAGEQVSGFLTWANTLASTISNAQITLQFSGNALNAGSVNATNGYYDSAHHTLTFNGVTNSSLASLQAGETDSAAFSFMTKSSSQLASLKNPTVQVSVSVSGQKDAGSAPETITNTLTRTVEIATDLEMSSAIIHSTGPFTNSGPWPPKVGTPTTYTVQLKATNTVNDVAGAVATMILPPYVTYTGQSSASAGTIQYDDTTRTVMWKIGTVAAGAGYATTAAQAAFQISFTPSSTQVGSSPTLVENQTLSGTDRFTNAQVGTTLSALTTETNTDPAYKTTFGEVSN